MTTTAIGPVGKKLIFSILLVLSPIIFSEVLLQTLALIFPHVKLISSNTAIKDEKLGIWRPNPRFPGHDEKGFRNKSVPKKISVVAMGDSQTYGDHLPPEEAWPQLLEQLGKIKVYNMAMGGYGPAHRLLLLDEAIELKPELIIEAFYTGNDLYDTYSLVYTNHQLAQLRTHNEYILSEVRRLEDDAPLVKQIARLYEGNEEITTGNIEEKHGTYRRVKNFLARYSKLYRLLWAVKKNLHYLYMQYNFKKYGDWETIKKNVLLRKDEYQNVLDNGKVKTILTPAYRLIALNLHDPRIAEGYRITLEIFRLMKNKTKSAGIDFAVLLIPTKEMVLREMLYEQKDPISQYSKSLIEFEEHVLNTTKQFLLGEHIKVIEALHILQEYAKNGKQPYGISANGHPNALGNRAIAEHALSEIKEQDLLRRGGAHGRPSPATCCR